MWRTSRQACLLCPWARHLTGCLRLYVADRWWGQAVYPSWWPSLTKGMQTEHELIRVNERQKSQCNRQTENSFFDFSIFLVCKALTYDSMCVCRYSPVSWLEQENTLTLRCPSQQQSLKFNVLSKYDLLPRSAKYYHYHCHGNSQANADSPSKT